MKDMLRCGDGFTSFYYSSILPFCRRAGSQNSCVLPFFSRVRFSPQRWEFIKENKKVRKQENKNSTMKATKKTRENKNSTKKATKKKRKNFLFYLIIFLVEFLFYCFLTLFYNFPPQGMTDKGKREGTLKRYAR